MHKILASNYDNDKIDEHMKAQTKEKSMVGCFSETLESQIF